MTKQNEKAKDLAISELYLLISNCYTLDVLKTKTIEICNKYFPQADETMINSFVEYSYFLQHSIFSFKNMIIVINNYAKIVKNR